MNKTTRQIVNNLRIPVASHEVIDTSAIKLNISDNATIRPANRLICNGFPFNKTSQSIHSFLSTIFSMFRAINVCKSYPLTTTSDERITVINLSAFCMIFHFLCSPPFRVFILCYNIIVTCKLYSLALGGFEPPRQLACGCQDRYVCQFHHSAITENQRGESSSPANPLSSPPLKYKSGHKYLSSINTIVIIFDDGDKTIANDTKQCI